MPNTSFKIMDILGNNLRNITLAAYGLPAVANPLTVTVTRCSPTDLGTNSALKTPSAV